MPLSRPPSPLPMIRRERPHPGEQPAEPLQVFRAERSPCSSGRRAGAGSSLRRAHPAVHDYAVLSFFTSGSATFEQGQRWQLGAGDVVLVPAGTPHRVVEERAAVRWSLGFCVPCFAGELGPLLEPFERVRAGGAAVVAISAERRGRLEGLFGDLAEATERRDRAGALVQRSLLSLVLDELGRADPLAGPALPKAPEGDVVAASLRFIERHCLSPLSLGDVAAAVQRSPAHLTTLLRRATGRSALQWIIAGRMAEARRRLVSSDEPVELIAERVGYADATHFIRLFRRAHGTTPVAWRAGQRTRRAGHALGH
jgi:AraC-like DNA-binding protein